MLTFILLAVNLIFAPHNPYMEKNSAFECGFSSFLGQNRTQFSISFFIFALLFLLFDLEILLVYPYLVSAYTNGIYGLVVMLIFLLALTLGFAFELGKKALSIDSRQMSNVLTNNKQKYIQHIRIKALLPTSKGFISRLLGLSIVYPNNKAVKHILDEMPFMKRYRIMKANANKNTYKSPYQNNKLFSTSAVKASPITENQINKKLKMRKMRKDEVTVWQN